MGCSMDLGNYGMLWGVPIIPPFTICPAAAATCITEWDYGVVLPSQWNISSSQGENNTFIVGDNLGAHHHWRLRDIGNKRVLQYTNLCPNEGAMFGWNWLLNISSWLLKISSMLLVHLFVFTFLQVHFPCSPSWAATQTALLPLKPRTMSSIMTTAFHAVTQINATLATLSRSPSP